MTSDACLTLHYITHTSPHTHTHLHIHQCTLTQQQYSYKYNRKLVSLGASPNNNALLQAILQSQTQTSQQSAMLAQELRLTQVPGGAVATYEGTLGGGLSQVFEDDSSQATSKSAARGLSPVRPLTQVCVVVVALILFPLLGLVLQISCCTIGVSVKFASDPTLRHTYIPPPTHTHTHTPYTGSAESKPCRLQRAGCRVCIASAGSSIIPTATAKCEHTHQCHQRESHEPALRNKS